MKRHIPLMFVLVAAALAALLVLPVSLRPVGAQGANKLGVHLLLDDGRNQWPVEVWREHLGYARYAVGNWGYVTELVRGDDLDPARWQVFMDLCAEFHLTPILRLATTYDRNARWWNAPVADADGTYRTTAARYAALVGGLRWPTGEHYVIVGNEPNHGDEWGGRPDPAGYARFLIDMSDVIQAVDPSARILNAGLDPFTPHTGSAPFNNGMYYMDSTTFLHEMVAAHPDVLQHIDVWASHSYPLGPLTEGPWLQTFQVDSINDAPAVQPPAAGIWNRGVNGYVYELTLLAQYGVSLPVMITETGWRHAETSDPAATDNGRPLPDVATVTAYLDLTLRGNGGRYSQYPAEGWTPWLDDPRVIAVTPFAFDGYPNEWGHTNWIALSPSGSVQATYPMVDLMAGISGS